MRSRLRVGDKMQGKVIVITGSSGVLGTAVAELARAQGGRVVSIDFAPASGDALSFGGVDLSDPAAANAVMAKAHAATGRIDALLNIAGGFAWSTIGDGDAAVWGRMHTINLVTALNASKAAMPHLIETHGAIVNVGAAAALKAGAGMGAYAASKSGVHKLTESLAEELKGKVRVNAVLPSILDTPQNRRDMPKVDPAIWVAPRDLAKVMLFLASDEAHAVTGALVPVTGEV
jgi:NAD(P)-dependent dehydrogenase (short-subunit alcohol dehydrogenase family)